MRIDIDRSLPTVPTDFSWQFGLGNDHAYQLHRKDVCRHIKLAHDELGIRYIRFHGIFDDDMLCYQRLYDYRAFRGIPAAKAIREINFRQIGDVFDNLLDCGVKPFVELSFMPSALAKGKKIGLRYGNNISMPRSMEQWREFIQRFIRFLLDRYGQEEAESWYFEVWNEPDLGIFFHGNQTDYFRLYAATARAVKSVDPHLRVGGPSTSACRWLPEFLSYCRSNDVPCDFVSTHHYPGDAFGNSFTAKNAMEMIKTASDCAKNDVPLTDALEKFFFHPEKFKHWDKGIFVQMDGKAKREVGDIPLFITEWNSMAVFGAPVHDEKFSAAFVVKTCLDLAGEAAGYMLWCCSDLFEEQFMLPKPFVGSFGIVSNDGVPKPNFWAFKLLSQLYPQRLQLPMRTNASLEYAAFTDGHAIQILLYAQDNDYEKDEKFEVELVVDLPAKAVTVQRIDDQHCNPKAEWRKMGAPDNLTRQQVKDICERTHLREENHPFAVTDGRTHIHVSLRTNDVVMLTIQ